MFDGFCGGGGLWTDVKGLILNGCILFGETTVKPSWGCVLIPLR